MNRNTALRLAAAVVVGAALVYVLTQGTGSDPEPAVAVTVPELSDVALAGETLFDQNCAECHGDNAAGTDQGPPLVHDIYEPDHHADISFVLAAQRGVRAHHWRFGDMPPQPEVSEEEVQRIVQYVRELQRANGVF